MTKAELIDAEDKLYQAVRKTYGYDEQADALVDIIWELVELASDSVEE